MSRGCYEAATRKLLLCNFSFLAKNYRVNSKTVYCMAFIRKGNRKPKTHHPLLLSGGVVERTRQAVVTDTRLVERRTTTSSSTLYSYNAVEQRARPALFSVVSGSLPTSPVLRLSLTIMLVVCLTICPVRMFVYHACV